MLGVSDEMFHTYLWRPTARRVALWRSNNKLTWLYAGDELRPPDAKPTNIFGTRSLVWPNPMYPAHEFARMKAQSSALFANAAYLCRQMYEEYQEPILCVCASRSSSRGVAAKLAEDFEPYEVLDEVITELVQFIETQAQHLLGLKRCLLSGVATTQPCHFACVNSSNGPSKSEFCAWYVPRRPWLKASICPSEFSRDG